MAESRLKIKATVNEINKHFKENPSKYFYIKWFNGEKSYNGDDNKVIVFETLIRHNEIGNRNLERSSSYTLQTLEKVLEEKVKEYEKESNIVEINSAKCDGGYNDTLIYSVEISLNGKSETISLERHSHDMQEPSETWEIISDLELSDENKEKIIQIISENPPAIYSDVPPKVYNQELLDEIEMGE